jgi:hypothetical protein
MAPLSCCPSDGPASRISERACPVRLRQRLDLVEQSGQLASHRRHLPAKPCNLPAAFPFTSDVEFSACVK